jgi:hypothetical protein
MKDIKRCLQLLDKFQSQYYYLEYQDYYDSNFKRWLKSTDLYEFKETDIIYNLKEYFSKNKLAYKKYCDPNDNNLKNAIIISKHKHEKCKRLLFKLIHDRIEYWWD